MQNDQDENLVEAGPRPCANRPSNRVSMSCRKRILRLAARLLIYFAIAFLVFNLVGIYVGSHMPRLTSDNVPLDFGMNAEKVLLKTKDGIILSAWYIPAAKKAPVIIFLHGLGTVKGDLVPMGRFLHEKGYALLFFDFRGCGESRGTYSSFGYQEQRDLEAAIDYLRSRDDADADNIGLIAVSMGSGVACLVAAREPAVKAIVLDSTFPSIEDVIGNVYRTFYMPTFPFAKLTKWLFELWFCVDADKIAPISVIDKIQPRGLLIISSGRDPIMRTESARKLYDAAGEPREFWLVPEAGHVGAYEARLREYERKVGTLFDTFLPITPDN